ncbi:FAD-dependent monooxygenase [Amycolatopsis rhabdoformis]|uniref:FAD-dependent monooxygenase n=1 Tax=Amycolatopsis rhabdoformis TaxID=1448059 RepID=A0ABZ1I7L8_9PSEU|nr:FAD-dependent monooxygenase [Amycolatopsis rhabdoformis]WSE30421.1 FAD-dependent monooxygenase [Amycolatopsis rhabdoformis]
MAELRIAVVGGGIGGLAAAAFLARAGLACTVYEQAAALGEVGAGLVASPNLVRLLRRLGVLPEFLARAVAIDVGWEFRRWADGGVLSAENLAEACERLYGERTYTVHRADLLSVVQAAVPPAAIRLGAKCVGVEAADDGAVLSFADGTTTTADVVIGADGVHSTVRGALLGPSPATFSGLCAFRALVPAADAPAFALRNAHTLWLGPDHHLVHYPISAGKLVNIVAFAPAGEDVVESWSATASHAQFAAEFEGWDPRLRELIAAAGTPGRWALLDRAPLARWSHGPVTLLGDAAHPMFPFFAQGAAQAVEDAAALAVCLATDATDPARALRRYESARRERTARLQTVSHERAHLNHLPDGPGQQARDAALSGQDPLAANAWIYGHDAELVP